MKRHPASLLVLFAALASSPAAWAQARPLRVGEGQSPALAVSGTGDVVLAWRATVRPLEPIVVQRFDELGSPVGRLTSVSVGPGQHLEPRAAAGEQGDFVVVWWGGFGGGFRPPGGDGEGSGAFLQRFDRAGRKIGPATIGIASPPLPTASALQGPAAPPTISRPIRPWQSAIASPR